MSTELEFDADAERVLGAARDLAEARGEAKGGAHLLLVALAHHGGSTVQTALAGVGLSPDAADTWLAQAMGPLRVRSPLDIVAPYAERTSVILGIARAEAATAGAASVRAADLPLAWFGSHTVNAEPQAHTSATWCQLRSAQGASGVAHPIRGSCADAA
ncbi:MAG: hypothetical protein R3C29_17690 [Dehalococcoidia bacterium]